MTHTHTHICLDTYSLTQIARSIQAVVYSYIIARGDQARLVGWCPLVPRTIIEPRTSQREGDRGTTDTLSNGLARTSPSNNTARQTRARAQTQQNKAQV